MRQKINEIKTRFFLLLLISSVFHSNSFGQNTVYFPYSILDTNSLVVDSISSSEFKYYVNSLLEMPIDSIHELDTLSKYSIKYLSECSFDVVFKDWNYLDSDHRICIRDISKSRDTLKLSFLDLRKNGRCYSAKLDTNELIFFYYPARDKSYEPFKPEIFSILSLNKGKHLILHTRITAPDTRGSMPPGFDFSLFFERVD